MFNWIPIEFHPFVGVIGLAILFVMVVSTIHRYREWQAEKMARVGRLMVGATALEHAILRLADIGMPQELGDFCREELLIRYREVEKLFPNMEGVRERIGHAEGLRLGQGPWRVPAISDEAQLQTYTLGLSGMLDMLSKHGAKSLAGVQSVRALREKIRVQRAEVQYLYHAKSSRDAAVNGEWSHAQEEVLHLMGFLKAKAPANERGKMLYQHAAQLYHHYTHQELPTEEETAELA